jgi:hypothetical protein
MIGIIFKHPMRTGGTGKAHMWSTPSHPPQQIILIGIIVIIPGSQSSRITDSPATILWAQRDGDILLNPTPFLTRFSYTLPIYFVIVQ